MNRVGNAGKEERDRETERQRESGRTLLQQTSEETVDDVTSEVHHVASYSQHVGIFLQGVVETEEHCGCPLVGIDWRVGG